MKLMKILAILFLATSCQADQSDYSNPGPDPRGSSPGLPKLYHVVGRIQCQSDQNWGYYCSPDPELRDATDCNNGNMRLEREQAHCCKVTLVNGKIQTNAWKIDYKPKSCSPLW
jgi:hypothetical protein